MALSDRMFAYHITGVSIAVIHNGAIRWTKGFGTMRFGGAPVNTDTLFQAASISKPVTAMAALGLVQSGTLNLNEDVNRYLKSWKLPDNGFTDRRKVTLRELLTHTAGITVRGFPGYAAGEPIPTLAQVLNGSPPANTPPIRVETVPGTQWRYSGGGYAIVQQLLIDVTGETFPQLMRQNVLDPLGMAHSTFEQPLPLGRRANTAVPYQATGEEVEGGAHAYPEMAAAGLWTTAGDLARFAIAVQNSLAGRRGAILSPELAAQMVAIEFGKRGVIFGLGGSSAKPYFAHSGGNEGFESYLMVYETGDGAVVMTNGDRGFDLAQEIVRSIAQEYRWPDFHAVEHTVCTVAPERLGKYAGCYQISPGVLVTITRRGDHLLAQRSDGEVWEMFPDSETHFFSKFSDAQITFKEDDRGRTTGVVVRQYGEDTEAKRIF